MAAPMMTPEEMRELKATYVLLVKVTCLGSW